MRTPGDRSQGQGPRPLGASLDEMSHRLGLGGSRGVGRLFARWAAIVGPHMAEHVQPVRIDRHALVVRVDHPAWGTQVRHLAVTLLDRVVDETGLPRPERVDVRIGR